VIEERQSRPRAYAARLTSDECIEKVMLKHNLRFRGGSLWNHGAEYEEDCGRAAEHGEPVAESDVEAAAAVQRDGVY
jgi:hypothetical protein